MPTRRSLLDGIGAALGVAGVGATAGCLGSLSRTGDGDGSGGGDGAPTGGATPTPAGPAYADRLYDPSAVMDAPVHGFATYDLGTLYDRRDLFPDRVVDRIERADAEFAAASLADLGRATAQGYTAAPVGELASPTGRITAGASAVVEGSFRPAALVDLLEAQVATGGSDLVEAGSAAGHDLYAVEFDDADRPPSMTLGVSGDSVGMGMTANADATGTDALTPMLEAAGGGGSAYYRASETAALLLDAFEDPTTATGTVANVDAYLDDAEETLPEDEHVRATVDGLRGVGTGSTLAGDRITSSVVGVYAEGETPTRDDLDGVIEWIRDQVADAPTTGPELPFDEVETSVAGRTVTASLSRDTDEFFGEDGMPAMGATGMLLFPITGILAGGYAVGGGVTTASGSDSASVRAPEHPTPPASFDFDYDGDADRVTIAMTSGEALTGDNSRAVRYGVPPEFSGWPLPVQAGDRVRVEDVESDDHVLVIWEGPDGDRSAVLGRFVVP